MRPNEAASAGGIGQGAALLRGLQTATAGTAVERHEVPEWLRVNPLMNASADAPIWLGSVGATQKACRRLKAPPSTQRRRRADAGTYSDNAPAWDPPVPTRTPGQIPLLTAPQRTAATGRITQSQLTVVRPLGSTLAPEPGT